jgi:hypothetical protein
MTTPNAENEALAIAQARAHLAGLLRACKKAAGAGHGVLTAKLLVKCIKGEFGHLQHVWK